MWVNIGEELFFIHSYALFLIKETINYLGWPKYIWQTWVSSSLWSVCRNIIEEKNIVSIPMNTFGPYWTMNTFIFFMLGRGDYFQLLKGIWAFFLEYLPYDKVCRRYL